MSNAGARARRAAPAALRLAGPGVEFPPAALDLPRLFLNARIYSAHSQFPTHISYKTHFLLTEHPAIKARGLGGMHFNLF